jgi:hypothetical protein
MYQVLGYPEAIIYVLLFIGLLGISKKYEHKKIRLFSDLSGNDIIGAWKRTI